MLGEPRVLLVVDPQALTVPLTRFTIQYWATTYAINIAKSFLDHGIDVEMESVMDLQKGNTPRLEENKKFDHALVILNHSSSIYGEELFTNIQKLLKKGGLIGQMGDDDLNIGFEDIRFYATSLSPDNLQEKKHQVLWGADPNIWNSEKDDSIFRILVDRKYYRKEKLDKTAELIKECIKFANNPIELPEGKKSVEVLGFGSSSLRQFTNEDQLGDVTYRPPGIPHHIYVNAFKSSDIFIVSHSESMGLSIIEAGMAGCLVVIPVLDDYGSYIKPDLAATVRAFDLPIIGNKINIQWKDLLSKVNSKKSRDFARNYTWNKLGKRVLEGFNLKSSPQNQLDIRDKTVPKKDTSTLKGINSLRWLMKANINFLIDSNDEDIITDFLYSWIMNQDFYNMYVELSDFSLLCLNERLIDDVIGLENIEVDDQKRKIAVGNILINVLKLSSDDLDLMPGFTEKDLNLISEGLYLSSQVMPQARIALQLADNDSKDYHSWSTGRMLYEGKRGRFDLHEKWIELEPECKDSWVVCMRSYWNAPNMRADCLRIGEEALKHFPTDEWINDIVNKCRAQLS
jgi:hypothetical protein